ncbi:MAG: hypothetical protein RIC51_10290, partial [Erythrobacter sp.]
FDDARYNPYPREVVIADNTVDAGATDPDLPGGEMLLAAFGGTLPPLVSDGLSDPGSPDIAALATHPDIRGWSLNLSRQGQPLAEAQPGPLDVPAYTSPWDMGEIGAPADLEARLQ